MENASKALIIAGAILISILLIGLGVYIYNQAQSTISTATLDSEVAQAQNQKFETYKGNNVTAAQVKQLLSLINTNNITAATSQDYKTIGVLFRYRGTGTTNNVIPTGGTNYTTDVTMITPSIKAGSTYKVSIPGVKTYDATKKGNDGFTNVGTNGTRQSTESAGAYYSNGYIRLIKIEENV